MCKVGDIILVNNYKSEGKALDRHSFIIISDENGKIEGVDYDFYQRQLKNLLKLGMRKKNSVLRILSKII